MSNLQIILLVGAKLQMIITKMGLRIQDRGEVIKGALVVEPGDHLFWFNNPKFLLFIIHLVLFQVILPCLLVVSRFDKKFRFNLIDTNL